MRPVTTADIVLLVALAIVLFAVSVAAHSMAVTIVVAACCGVAVAVLLRRLR